MVLLSNDVVRRYPDRFNVPPDEHSDLEERRKEFEATFGRFANKTWVGDLHKALQEIKPAWTRLGGRVQELDIYYNVIHRHADLHLHNTSSAGLRGILSYDADDRFDAHDLDVALRSANWCLMASASIVADQFAHDRAELEELAREGERVFLTLTPAHRAKLGRNDPCWCGSGKKLKKCHGI